MDFKKRVNGSWTDTPNYIHNTFTDTITTLPTDIYTNDTTATVGLKGQMEQNGTPTPDNPIQPQEAGERTCNLFDENYSNIKTDTPAYRSIYVGDGTFTLSTTTARHRNAANVFFLAGNVKSGASTQNNGIWNGNPRTVTAVDGYITIAYRYYMGNEESDPRSNDVMLNTGSTALPYEPYGYKLTISSANTTTPVYLGEVESTRQIKKLVLTGKETFYRDKEQANSWRFYSDRLVSANYNLSICSHFVNIGTSGVDNTDNIGFSLFNTSQFGCRCPKSVANTVDEFKAWLANQYAAGTPITVWYVLAEPETAVVNEPLRKIGDYADTVSGIIIPTIAGTNTIDIDTTLKPSEVSVNYHGWHPVKDVHRFNGTSWD